MAILEARGLRPAEIADRLSTKNRATFYRVRSGETNDPRTGTLVEICNALAIGPSELLQLAGLYGSETSRLRLIDLELRQAFAEAHQLDEDGKRECIILLRGVIGLRAQRKDARLRRRTSRQDADT